MNWKPSLPICFAHAWRHVAAVGMSMGLLLLIWLSASPQHHHELHHECDEGSQTCVVSQWLSGGAILASSPLVVVVTWIRSGRAWVKPAPAGHFRAGVWMWAQGPPAHFAKN